MSSVGGVLEGVEMRFRRVRAFEGIEGWEEIGGNVVISTRDGSFLIRIIDRKVVSYLTWLSV